MSLFHSQTIFNILITLLICSAMFIFFRFKLRILEVSQREQAKVLQSLVMNMRNGGQQRNMVSGEMMQQMQMQQAGAGAGAGDQGHNHHHTNDLINVSDDDDDDGDDDDVSESSSESGDDDTDSSSSEDENDINNNNESHDNTTKKIIFNNNGTLDTHIHNIEHLTGDDIKVIELTEPLYPIGGGIVSGSKVSNHDTNDVSDDEDGEDASYNDDDDDDDDEETSDDTEVKVEELPSSHEEQQHQLQHLETSTIDTTEIKTIFKADKQQQPHTDYNSMNAQTLKQHLKTKLSADGLQYNETAINKLNKKELIKHLTQG